MSLSGDEPWLFHREFEQHLLDQCIERLSYQVVDVLLRETALHRLFQRRAQSLLLRPNCRKGMDLL